MLCALLSEFIVYCALVEAEISELPVVSLAFRKLCDTCRHYVNISRMDKICPLGSDYAEVNAVLLF